MTKEMKKPSKYPLTRWAIDARRNRLMRLQVRIDSSIKSSLGVVYVDNKGRIWPYGTYATEAAAWNDLHKEAQDDHRLALRDLKAAQREVALTKKALQRCAKHLPRRKK